jgi:mRNA deadenylase 3'-5' endonuclease subunit Ccr4
LLDDDWKPNVKPLNSAYKIFSAKKTEPEFTNYAKIKDEPTFIATLDYIFYSHHEELLSVRDVKKLPNRVELEVGVEEGGGGVPLPNKYEPSDHLLLSATFKLL